MNKACKLLLFLLVVGLSCQKDATVKKEALPVGQQDLSFIKKARSYYYRDLRENKGDSTRRIKKLYPYWNYAYSSKTKGNIEFVEVPVVSERQRTHTIDQLVPGAAVSNVTKESELPVLSASLQRLVIFKTKDGRFEQRVVNYIPDKAYLQKANHDISRNHIDKLDPNFSGYMHYSDKNGHVLYILKIQNGKWVSKINHRTVSSAARADGTPFKPQPRNAQTARQVCQTFLVTVWEQTCYDFEPDGPNGPSEEICTDWYIADQYTEEECWEEDDDPCSSGCGDPTPDPEPAPGDKLCSNSINFRSSDASHIANVNGLKFEGSNGVNNLPGSLFSLTNGIREASLNTVPVPDYLGAGKSSMQYLHDFFPDLFTSGQITSTIENGEFIWNFTPAAAQQISSRASNLAALGVVMSMGPAASIPNNSAAWLEFYSQATSLIRSWMPGSAIKQGYSPNGNNSTASYSPTCN